MFKTKGLLLAILLFFMTAVWVFAAEKLNIGPNLPSFTFEKPMSAEAQEYLGLPKMEPFTISQIKGKMVIIEIMSSFCSGCIENAPTVNRLYSSLLGDETLKKDVKLLAIGVGNKPKELEAFQKVHRVKFPLIPDEDGDVWTALGSAATPAMVIATPSGKVLYTHVGTIKDLDAFLKEIKELHKKQ